MALFKCKMCGGSLEVQPGESVAVCDSCGSKQTLPKLDDERRANLYDRANHFRRNGQFDKAEGIYESILNETPEDAEAYWSLVLCRYGIDYVRDPRSGKQVPTVNRAQYGSVQADEDYLSAIRYADGYQKDIYENEAKAIDRIQKGILAISQKEEPFDVFICYKELDEAGERTKDSVYAQDIYNALTREGYKVFFSRITLEDKLGAEFEPYIFAALNSAKLMLVVGTSRDNLESPWVRNEWSRYLALIKKGENKTLIPVYAEMSPYDFPEEFSTLMAQDLSKMGFKQDLLHAAEKICAKKEPAKSEPAVINPVYSTPSSSISPLLKRAFMFLEDKDWNSANDYCEKVLDQDPENAQAYLGKLLAELKLSKVSDLANCERPFDNNSNYSKAVRFGSSELKSELQEYLKEIKDREENAQKEAARIAEEKRAARENFSVKVNAKAKKILKFVIPGAAALIAFFIVLTKVIIPNGNYNKAVKLYNAGQYEEAIAGFEALNGYKDSEEQVKCCNTAITEEQYNYAVELYNSGKYKDAMIAFEALDGYKDSAEKISAIKHSNEYFGFAEVGDTFFFGNYGSEEIEWRVLDKQDDKVLVISEYGLDAKPYNEAWDETTWEKCTLRKWLNNEFLNSAFSAGEQAMIQTTKVTADRNPSYDTDPGNDTEDKVFLLSIDEAKMFFASDDDRICYPTDYAVSNGCWTSTSSGSCWWWLRSPGHYSSLAAYVGFGGVVNDIGISVRHSNYAVRPALWINLES